jgi:hypothetical protein
MKSEARNFEQIQMTKKHNVPNNPDSDSRFWNCSGFVLFGCGSSRISLFEIRIYPCAACFGPRGLFRNSEFWICFAGCLARVNPTAEKQRIAK